MAVAEQMSEGAGFRRPATHTLGDAERVMCNPDVTVGDLVDAVASVTDDATEVVLVVRHILRTRKAIWRGPTPGRERAADLARPMQ